MSINVNPLPFVLLVYNNTMERTHYMYLTSISDGDIYDNTPRKSKNRMIPSIQLNPGTEYEIGVVELRKTMTHHEVKCGLHITMSHRKISPHAHLSPVSRLTTSLYVKCNPC